MADRSRNRNYRNWTITEDAKLVEALINMVNTGGFKADNGFKSGYLQYLEQVMKDSVPESHILGRPHIESRIKTMKKDWQVVHDMVNGTNTSGFGYDSVKQCVTAEAPVWESYLKVHKEAAKWRNKTFPHFEDLSIVFGKDRAQGSRAMDVVEMEDRVNLEEQEQTEETESSHNVHNATDMRSEEGSSRGSKKRKTRVDTLVDGMHSAALLLGEKFENATKNMVDTEMEIQKKTSMVNYELAKIQSLSRMERFRAIKKITDEPNNVLIFWSLEESEREEWVRFILES